jgi:hypothetical protein
MTCTAQEECTTGVAGTQEGSGWIFSAAGQDSGGAYNKGKLGTADCLPG